MSTSSNSLTALCGCPKRSLVYLIYVVEAHQLTPQLVYVPREHKWTHSNTHTHIMSRVCVVGSLAKDRHKKCSRRDLDLVSHVFPTAMGMGRSLRYQAMTKNISDGPHLSTIRHEPTIHRKTILRNY
ncbi:hypothetical protein RRG08_023289 [Elysia crispata]|uniref:Uncharacterized protein n=1 Tax=Elysia crispata TaxID=231223 RepID=A0AAE1BCF1_9GAST|nr:hypothetical protein RRG08_023289 [Elysia crispata]